MRLLPMLLLVATCSAISAGLPRSQTEVRAFRDQNPCPSTGCSRGACPGWQVDHIPPLCAGGEDSRENMQWLSVDDHRWKTFVDLRECRKLRKAAATPAQ